MIFPHSRDLKQIIERQGWSLYDAFLSPARIEPLTWDEINLCSPVQHYEIGRTYMLLPEPKKGQNLSDALADSRRDALIPVFNIPRQEKRLDLKPSGKFAFGQVDFYFLSYFHFKNEVVVAGSDPFFYPPYSSTLYIPNDKVLESFTSYFGIIKIGSDGRPIEVKPKFLLN